MSGEKHTSEGNSSGTREPGGGGQWGQLVPTTLKLWGRRRSPPPPTLDCECHSFIFLLVFARELGSLLKNSGPNPVNFSFG